MSKNIPWDALKKRAFDLLQAPLVNDMGHCEYDTAWVARVPVPGQKRPAFPEVLEIVRAGQALDGGWAPETNYVSARVLATLSSILAITEFDLDESARESAARGAAFVCESWARLEPVRNLTNGFELLAATMIRDAIARGLALQPIWDAAHDLYERKRRLVPDAAIYSPHAPLSYSLEFLGDELDPVKAKGLLLPDGAIGASPAATAYYVRQTGDERALAYLRRLVAEMGPRGISYGWPATLFSWIWSLRPMMISGLLKGILSGARPVLDTLQLELTPRGMTWAFGLQYTDGDTTPVVLRLLDDHGYLVDWSVLLPFERERWFVAYPFEHGASPSVNANTLWSIKGRPYPGGAASCRKAAAYLLETQEKDGYWTDKWHSSPLYPTAWAIEALLPEHPETARRTLSWLIRSEHSGGGWGWHGRVTAEETAFAVQILAACQRHGLLVPAGLGSRARPLLLQILAETNSPLPQLWIAKTLYAPRSIVESQVLAAIVLGADLS